MDDINVDIREMDVSTATDSGSAFVDHVVAWGTVGTALFTLLLVWMANRAWRTAKETLKAATEANEQAKADSIRQTRPYVYAEVIPSIGGSGAYDLRVRNVGRSAARSLTLAYEPWPASTDEYAERLGTFFRTARTLPPGAEIRSYWRLTPSGDAETFTDGTTEAGLGSGGKITVKYTSDDPSNPEYEDEFDVMIDNSGVWPGGYAGPEVPSSVTGSAKAFYRLGQALVHRVSELGR